MLETADQAWFDRLTALLGLNAIRTAPRGQSTLELYNYQPMRVDLRYPLILEPTRKLNYRFAAAEALWILRGDNRLAPLTKHVKRMAQFSDDDEHLSGAYGPPVVDQLPYVVRTLLNDRDSRQAVLTTWRPKPGPSKDIPCTVAMAFFIRHNQLHQHVFMRSSDVWLGVPYDLFSFAMIAWWVRCAYNRRVDFDTGQIGLGELALTAVSSHLYERDVGKVETTLRSMLKYPEAGFSEFYDWRTVEQRLIKMEESGEWEAML